MSEGTTTTRLVETPATPPTIVEALAHVMAKVRAVGKDSQAPGNIGGYRFRGIDAIVNAVGPVLREVGVVVMPEVLHVERVTTQSRNGAAMLNVYVTTRYTFTGPAGDSLACTVLGEASDAGDKATAKAQSVAFRVALLQALCLPTDEPDPDESAYERAGADRQTATPMPPVADEPEHVRRARAALDTLNADQVGHMRDWWQMKGLPNLPVLNPDQATEVIDTATAIRENWLPH